MSLYFIARIIRQGFTWRSGLLGGAAIAGAYLRKINAIVLPVPLELALLSDRRRWGQRLVGLVALGGLMLALVFPGRCAISWRLLSLREAPHAEVSTGEGVCDEQDNRGDYREGEKGRNLPTPHSASTFDGAK